MVTGGDGEWVWRAGDGCWVLRMLGACADLGPAHAGNSRSTGACACWEPAHASTRACWGLRCVRGPAQLSALTCRTAAQLLSSKFEDCPIQAIRPMQKCNLCLWISSGPSQGPGCCLKHSWGACPGQRLVRAAEALKVCGRLQGRSFLTGLKGQLSGPHTPVLALVKLPGSSLPR